VKVGSLSGFTSVVPRGYEGLEDLDFIFYMVDPENVSPPHTPSREGDSAALPLSNSRLTEPGLFELQLFIGNWKTPLRSGDGAREDSLWQ
jgi:hypothetical protein